ncbi:putative disease resistance protein RGA3 [Citrus sinensis]|nr:putative disease resistance protein RGA3 [Citrus sinensis]XP_052299947.1 putative disease resistance protein RGA3 [Citrus sinensis]
MAEEMTVSTVLDQLSSITQQMNEARLVVGGVVTDVEKLRNHLKAIQEVLDDAEKRQVKEKAVEDWLRELKDTSYAIDDTLDEWNTAIQKLLLANETDHKASKVRSFTCHLPIALRFDIGCKLKNLSRRVDAIAGKKGGFEFKLMSGPGEKIIIMTSSEAIDPLEFHGRNVEKKNILQLLKGESSDEESGSKPTLPVIWILGKEGIGKTALARQVFDDSDVKANFDKRIWVSASCPRDEIRVAKAILESLKGSVSSQVEMETVLQYINEFVQGKKVLLVLDDVWWNACPRYWEQLMYSLKSGSEGSRILVTRRGEKNGTNMTEIGLGEKDGTNMTEIGLGELSAKECRSLFRQIAFDGRSSDDREKFEPIGRLVVGKCKGLPFAVKILGSLLRFKTSIEEWQSVLDSEIWNLDSKICKRAGVGDEYFSPLLLSYYDLSPALKKCFLYCSIFPKNYEIEKDRLIKLWMAQGYLKLLESEDMEVIGEEYFANLASRSLFQDFQKSEFDGRIIRCQMHPIVHEFAHFLTKSDNFNAEVKVSDQECRSKSSHEKFPHLMITFESDQGAFPNSVYNQKKLRSLGVEHGGGFMNGIVLSKVFDQLTCLRTLELSNHDNVLCKVIKKVPKQIKRLIHLRYLNLSKNKKIKKLPKTLCELYNLQTLELSWCSNLRNLPQGMGKLINLRHVVNVGTPLSYMPKGIERWSCLRTLSEFIVSGGNDDKKASKLECLKSLNHLQGSLNIKGLGNVDKDEIFKAELSKREKLLALGISFDRDDEEGRKKEDDEAVVEGLELPSNLESMEMFYYRGESISLMMIMLSNKLRSLTLDRCVNLKQLPGLGGLPSLESLTLRNMKRIEKVGNEFLLTDRTSSTGTAVSAFPKLKSLVFLKMKAWREWKYKTKRGKHYKIMPCLCSLTIGYCNELEMLPAEHFPDTLKDLKIISCSKLEKSYEEGKAEWKMFPQIKFSHD